MYSNVAITSPVIYRDLREIQDRAKVIIFDAWGVFYDGKKLYEGSSELMHELMEKGKLVYVLSNTTQSSGEAMASYEKRGLRKGEHYHRFITSGDFMSNTLKAGQLVFKSIENPKNVYIFGVPNRKMFEGTKYTIVDKIEEAHFVYISIPQLTEEQYSSYPHKEQLIESGANFFGAVGRRWDSLTIDPFMPELENFRKNNLPVVIGNPDLVSEEHGKDSDKSNFVIRQGSIAQAYRKLGGEVVAFGKPDKSIYNIIFLDIGERGLSVKKDEIFMVGDTIGTDIKGAKNTGIKSVLCTETGVTANEVKTRLKQELTKFEKNKDKSDAQTKRIKEIKESILIDLQKEEDCMADYLIERVSKVQGYN
jgi:HAD superfamily hydrolase (TIGR01450 family)